MTYYLNIGSNLDDREGNLWAADLRLSLDLGLVVARSSIVESEPWGFESDNVFMNAVALFRTTLSPRELLVATQAIERELGREHKSVEGHYADRPIDIDILLYGDQVVDEPDLTIPHPRMKERPFVMQPLSELLSFDERAPHF